MRLIPIPWPYGHRVLTLLWNIFALVILDDFGIWLAVLSFWHLIPGGGGGGGRGMKRVRGDFRTNTQLSSRNNLCHNIDHHNMFSHLSSIGLPVENWKHYKLWTMFPPCIIKITGDQRICCAVALFSAQRRKKQMCIAWQCAFSMSCLRAVLLINRGNQEIGKSYTCISCASGPKEMINITRSLPFPKYL